MQDPEKGQVTSETHPAYYQLGDIVMDLSLLVL
jgi:hypothetical protein